MPPKAKRRWPSQDDKRLKTYAYQQIVKHWGEYVREITRQGGAVECQATVCLLPGQPIRVGGTRTPYHLDVGHELAREHDTRTSWTLADTRPEHARCNRAEGVRIREAKKRAAQQASQHTVSKPDPLTIDTNDW